MHVFHTNSHKTSPSQSGRGPKAKRRCRGYKSGLKIEKQSRQNTYVILISPSDCGIQHPKQLAQSEKETLTTIGGGPTSLGATSEEGAHPQLSSDQTKSARDGLKTAHTDSGTNEESRVDEISKKIKLKDLSDLLKDIRSTFFTPDSLQDEPIIVSDESEEEEEVDKDNDTHATSHDVPEDTLIPHPPSPKLDQIQELMAHALVSRHQPDYCPTWQFLDLPCKISSVQKKLKTLDSLPSLLNKVTETLNRFATMVENTSGATTKDVPSVGQATASPAEGEKNTHPTITNDEPNMHKELVDLLGIDVVTQYYNKKLLYDKYCDKMLKRRKSSKITNCDVLTQKGHISLKVHREDGTNEVISNVKVGDLHMAE
ncbi:hypothetical protein Tco_0612984 [Tanacetum coccineum]